MRNPKIIFFLIFKFIFRHNKKIVLNTFTYFFTKYWEKESLKFIEKRKDKIRKKKKPLVIFTDDILISYKFWSKSLKEIGVPSKIIGYAIMEKNYITEKKDFSYYYEDIVKIQLRALKRKNKILSFIFQVISRVDESFLNSFIILDYLFKKGDVIVSSLHPLRILNYHSYKHYFKKFGCKTVIFPYGSDFWQYSKLEDPSFKLTLLMHYPQYATEEDTIYEHLKFWVKNADFISMGAAMDGLGRVDMFMVNYILIDTGIWVAKKEYSYNDGKNGVVNIVHTPNHRFIKGTEYIIQAVEELKKEGYKIELMLLEKVKNQLVREILYSKADILVEKIIHNGCYAQSALEGMATGIPVISNFENEKVAKAFRRYSYLDECPLIFSNPENIKDDLKTLIENPQLRIELGKAGRSYVEKYHSFKTFQFIFSNILEKIWWENKEINLTTLFHPLLKNSYNNLYPKITHHLKNNRIIIN